MVEYQYHTPPTFNEMVNSLGKQVKCVIAPDNSHIPSGQYTGTIDHDDWSDNGLVIIIKLETGKLRVPIQSDEDLSRYQVEFL